jgi:hypothetical protein
MYQITTGNCGLVLHTDRPSERSSRTTDRRRPSRDDGGERTGHFILSRYRVDDDGHVCLTSSLPLSELGGSIERLTAELESLLEQARQHFADTTQVL